MERCEEPTGHRAQHAAATFWTRCTSAATQGWVLVGEAGGAGGRLGQSGCWALAFAEKGAPQEGCPEIVGARGRMRDWCPRARARPAAARNMELAARGRGAGQPLAMWQHVGGQSPPDRSARCRFWRLHQDPGQSGRGRWVRQARDTNMCGCEATYHHMASRERAAHWGCRR